MRNWHLGCGGHNVLSPAFSQTLRVAGGLIPIQMSEKTGSHQCNYLPKQRPQPLCPSSEDRRDEISFLDAFFCLSKTIDRYNGTHALRSRGGYLLYESESIDSMLVCRNALTVATRANSQCRYPQPNHVDTENNACLWNLLVQLSVPFLSL